MKRHGESLERLQREIAAEKAAALGRAGERLEEALREERELAAAVIRARGTADAELVAREHAAARQRARQARHALIIQREALGLRHHAVVDQQFPEPRAP
jgi:hypothetical protein